LVKKRYFEVKAGNSSHSSNEREFSEDHPRSYDTINVDGDNMLHDAREIGRNAKKLWDKLP